MLCVTGTLEQHAVCECSPNLALAQNAMGPGAVYMQHLQHCAPVNLDVLPANLQRYWSCNIFSVILGIVNYCNGALKQHHKYTCTCMFMMYTYTHTYINKSVHINTNK